MESKIEKHEAVLYQGLCKKCGKNSGAPTHPEKEDELSLAFHRGVDAAKDAIRAEIDADRVLVDSLPKEDRRRDDELFAHHGTMFINAIARRCRRDGD